MGDLKRIEKPVKNQLSLCPFLHESLRYPKDTSEGVEITLPVSNQELASQIGTVRELISRNLSRLQAEGMLKIDGRSLTICNLKALEAEQHSPE